MWARLARAGLGMATLVTSGAPCTRDRPAALGVASGALEADYCLLNVHTDEETVHFEGPESLLGSVEGRGPLSGTFLLDFRIQDLLIPRMTTTGRDKPRNSTVSTAVGYSMEERYGFTDFARLTVSAGVFQRVEAYANFERTVFEIHDASCGTFLGFGAAYRPIGVYFKTVDAEDVALPDIGVHVYVQTPDGPPPGGTVPEDAGAARDGGAVPEDAGAARDGG